MNLTSLDFRQEKNYVYGKHDMEVEPYKKSYI